MSLSIQHAFGVRSDFSIGESLLQIDKIIRSAKDLGYETVAVADTMSISCLADFSTQAKKAGIKPIIGVRLRVADDPTWRKPSKASGEKDKPNPTVYLKAYALNETGVKSLLKLLTRANTEEYFYYVPRCGWRDVLALEGVAITTGDFYSLWHHPDWRGRLKQLHDAFGEQVYCELVPVDTPLFDTLNHKAAMGATEWGLPTLVSYPALYQQASDAPTWEVLQAIANNDKMDSPWLQKPFIQDFHLHQPIDVLKKASAAAKRISAHYPPVGPGISKLLVEGVKNLKTLADACAFTFQKLDVCLPKMAEDEFAELVKLAKAGWARRFAAPVLGHQPGATDLPVYKARLAYELGVLRDMGFAGYFLLVHDLIRWAKAAGISVGPGRGSVGGSLIAYLIGITEVDPIRFNLIFERFINPERLDLPDVDMDFMSSRRQEVIDYLKNKYGEDYVKGIANYTTMAAAGALREAGRVFGVIGVEMTASKLVPKEHGASFTLEEAAVAVPEIDQFKAKNPALWQHALVLEGNMRSLGQHAAGIVVAGEPIVNRAVIERRKDGHVINWDKAHVETFGLIKMDILGLSTLDILEHARNYIRQRHHIEVDYTRLDINDEAVMEAFGKGQAIGVFQFESPGMRKLLKDLRMGGRLTFDDISAATALYRPGPMDSGLLDDFVASKQGLRETSFEHPNMEKATKDTFGVLVYQEQIMQVARDLAGFTFAEADHLRKAIGKKDLDKMLEMKDRFIEGAFSHSGMDGHGAAVLWDKIEQFAAYSFNKSHSVEYSLISFWSMWAKINYPAEFFAAALSVVKEEKLAGLVKDARDHGIEVLPPDINRSTQRFEIVSDSEVLAPFNMIKGISENTANHILDARLKKGGPFTSKDDFLAHVNKTKVNVRAQGALERVGAFAGIEPGLPARHPDRVKDQMELLPGLIIDVIKATRGIVVDSIFKAKLMTIITACKSCTGCDLAGGVHPTPRLGRAPKFMVVGDGPNWKEDQAGKLMEGDAAEALKLAMGKSGLGMQDGYFTSLMKTIKPKGEKFYANAQLNACRGFLQQEVELLKPPIIIALGSAAIRHFLPDVKGGSNELAGKVVFVPALDASVICGINPAQLFHDPSKQKILDEIFTKVGEMLA